MKKIFKILALLVLFSGFAYAQNPVQHIPFFTFYRLDNRIFTEKDIAKGRKVFFIFFDSSCEHCQHAVHDIVMHYGRFKRATIYMVTLDDRKTIDYFMSKYGEGIAGKPNVTILQDRQNEFIIKFSPRKYPSMLLFSKNGTLLRYGDDDKNLSQIYDRL